jgi:pimeloyl-ACP methyl ester carboxylesterase
MRGARKLGVEVISRKGGESGGASWVWLFFLAIVSGGSFAFTQESRSEFKTRFDFPSIYPEKRFQFEKGMTLNYVDRGEGPVLLFLHGLAADHHQWNDNMPAFEGRFRLLALDFPGHGKSSRVLGYPYGIPRFTAAVIALLDHLGIEKVSLIGNSMGGHVSLSLAYHHPKRVERLILVDSAGVDRMASWRLGLVNWVRQRDMIRLAVPPVTRGFTPLVIWQRRDCAITREIREKIEMSRRDPQEKELFVDLLGRCLISIDQDHFRDRLSQIEQPTLIVWGVQDLLVPVRHAWKLRRALPRSRMVLYPLVGHVPSVEVPDRFNRHVLSFLHSRESLARRR